MILRTTTIIKHSFTLMTYLFSVYFIVYGGVTMLVLRILFSTSTVTHPVYFYIKKEVED